MHSRPRGFEHYFVSSPKSRPALGLIRTHLRGRFFQFVTASGVFSKQKIDLGTRLLIESMVLPESGRVLDVGCGYGAIGIAAATFNPNLTVYLADPNIRAVRLARDNVEINKAKNAVVEYGHFFEPFDELVFDCILSNPPVSAGMKTVKMIICEAPKHMSENGSFQMVVRSKIAGKRLLGFFGEAFGKTEILARGSGYRVLISRKQ